MLVSYYFAAEIGSNIVEKIPEWAELQLEGMGWRWLESAGYSCLFMAMVTAEGEWGVDQPAKAYRRDRLFSMNAEGIAIDADMKQKMEEWKWRGEKLKEHAKVDVEDS